MLIKISFLLTINIIAANQFSHIDDLKWKNRLLIIRNDGLKVLKKIEYHKEGFDERDFIIICIKAKDVFIDKGITSKLFSKSVLKKIQKTSDEHNIILIGKDGDIKKHYKPKVMIESIFFDVDQMPMRKHEVRSENK